VLTYSLVFGDPFALATAEYVEATLLIGDDDDYSEVYDMPIEQLHSGSG